MTIRKPATTARKTPLAAKRPAAKGSPATKRRAPASPPATVQGDAAPAPRGTLRKGVPPVSRAAARKRVAPVPQTAARKDVPPSQPARKSAAPRRVKADEPVASVRELMAYAYALEAEAAERYAEFAEAMENHNNLAVAELFRKLSRIELRHSEQVLEEMGWVSPPPPSTGGYQWQGLEGPETGDMSDLHYLMQPHHALSIARHNEQRAEQFFMLLAKTASSASVRNAAMEMAAEETEHVRLIDEWLKRTPAPDPDWAFDPDPPVLSD